MRDEWRAYMAAIGGLAMKLLMTLSGLGLFTLGSFATYSFWARRSGKRRARSRRDMHLYSCANG